MPMSQIPIYFRSTEIPFSCENRPFSTSIEFCLPQFYKCFVLHSERNVSRITNFKLATHQVPLAQTFPMYCTLALTWKTIVNVLFLLLLSIY